MKNKLLLSSLRKIKSSSKRFISLLFLAMLGVGFFVGIKASSPDMLVTLDNYLDNYNVYDLEIKSYTGLTSSDVSLVEELDISENITLVKSIDEIVIINDQESVFKFISLSDVNDVILIDGEIPSSSDEIVVEKSFLSDNNLSIGDFIEVSNYLLNYSSFKIVGVIESPIYFTNYRGTTSVGDGEIDYFSYVLEDAFNMPYYTSMYISLRNARELVTESDEYLELVKDARESLEEINSWFVFDRSSNQGYSSFIDSAESMSKIGSVFPLVFYIISILISLISMMRMIDEDRIEIGTLKGLGFSNFHIVFKYVMYSSLATIIGGLVGMLIGFNLFPRVIWGIYESLFYIPTFVCEFNLFYAFIGEVLALVCISGASILVCFKTLKERPSNLMRSKAPKNGKKIFLERFTFLWSKVSFSNKVTIRNIFRYKKRILVTIIGILGSTSLILCGFGLKDSMTSIVYYNYNNVFVYDKMISLKSNSDIEDLLSLIDSNQDIANSVSVNYQVTNVYNKEKELKEVNLIVPSNHLELSNVIRLNDINNDKKLIDLSDDSVVLSEKLAKTLGVKKYDKVSFLVNDEYKELEVSYIVENYINDYAYMTKETYMNLFGDYSVNVIFLGVSDNYDNGFDKVIMNEECVSNVISTSTTFNLIKDILSSLDSVVIILIISSACLAFVILYNLSNINISERKREISTLKVLGFYDEEVDSYITKENYFTTIIGIILGLFCGVYLSHYVITTCELQYVMFVKHVEISSYVYSIIISLVFTFIVNRFTHHNLKKIDMVESLKSNE